MTNRGDRPAPPGGLRARRVGAGGALALVGLLLFGRQQPDAAADPIPLPEPSALAPTAAGTGRPSDGIGSDDTEQLAFQIHPREIPLTVHAVIQLDVGAVVPFQAYRLAAGR